jgi:hypothetical protein
VKDCPTATHRSETKWKAYAGVERWRDQPHEDWLPEVLEITEALWKLLIGRTLRAEVWTLFRQNGRHGNRECTGHHVDTVNADKLRTDVSVEPTVYRVYRTPDILWGVEPYLPVVPLLLPSKDAPPSNAKQQAQRKPEQPPVSPRAFAERLRRGPAPAASAVDEVLNRNGQHS